LTFYLEPWGEVYMMPPDATFEVVARGPQGDCLEIELADDRVTVYGWPGSKATLFDGGAEAGAGLRDRAPAPPTPRRE